MGVNRLSQTNVGGNVIAMSRHKGDAEGFNERVESPEGGGNNDFCETCLDRRAQPLPSTDNNRKIRVLVHVYIRCVAELHLADSLSSFLCGRRRRRERIHGGPRSIRRNKSRWTDPEELERRDKRERGRGFDRSIGWSVARQTEVKRGGEMSR